ncbi:MAG: hypothetical protein PHC62_00185 [Candidatus Izemoplasmatales bacterium]|nr:hypothetical protein [Candidatus Izemoplasmatales bacterium]
MNAGLNNEFLDLIKLSKQMKKPIVKFQPHKLIGIDEQFASITTYEINEEKFPLFHEMKVNDNQPLELTVIINDLIAWIKKVDFDKVNIVQWGFFYDEGKTYFPNDFDLMRAVNQLTSKVMNLTSCDPYISDMYSKLIIDHYDLRGDDQFEELLKLKTVDGSRMFHLLNQYMMSTFSTIHPLTKSDKISVSVYELEYGASFLAVFHIIKKGQLMNEFIRYRNLLPCGIGV